MAAALPGAQEVSLAGVLADWDLPSCKAKLNGRYNTDNLAYGDKRAQLASTVLNAAGIQVTRRTDSRCSPTNMDDQDWDAMEIVDSTYKEAMTRPEVEIQDIKWSPANDFEGLRVHLLPSSSWSVSILNFSGERAPAERRVGRALETDDIATQDIVDILVQDRDNDGGRQGEPKPMPAVVLDIMIDIFIDSWDKEYPEIQERAVHVLVCNQQLARVQCVHHSRQRVRQEWETRTAEMIGVAYNVADAMTNIDSQGQGPADISTAWPARIMLLYGSHSSTIDEWIKKKNPFGADGAQADWFGMLTHDDFVPADLRSHLHVLELSFTPSDYPYEHPQIFITPSELKKHEILLLDKYKLADVRVHCPLVKDSYSHFLYGRIKAPSQLPRTIPRMDDRGPGDDEPSQGSGKRAVGAVHFSNSSYKGAFYKEAQNIKPSTTALSKAFLDKLPKFLEDYETVDDKDMYKLALRAARAVYEALGAAKVKEFQLPDLPPAPAIAPRKNPPAASASRARPPAKRHRCRIDLADDDEYNEDDDEEMEMVDDDDDVEEALPLLKPPNKVGRGIARQLEAINGKLVAMPNHEDKFKTINDNLSKVVSAVEDMAQKVEGMGKKEGTIQDSEKFRQMTAILSTMASLTAVLEPSKADTPGGQSDARGQAEALQRMCDSQYHNICNLVENIFCWSQQEQTNLYSSLKSIQYFKEKLKPTPAPDKSADK